MLNLLDKRQQRRVYDSIMSALQEKYQSITNPLECEMHAAALTGAACRHLDQSEESEPLQVILHDITATAYMNMAKQLHQRVNAP